MFLSEISKANEFGRYFASAYTEKNRSSPYIVYPGYKDIDDLNSNVTNFDNVWKAIPPRLSKMIDSFPSTAFQKLSFALALPLHDIFTTIHNENKLPYIWKKNLGPSCS